MAAAYEVSVWVIIYHREISWMSKKEKTLSLVNNYHIQQKNVPEILQNKLEQNKTILHFLVSHRWENMISKSSDLCSVVNFKTLWELDKHFSHREMRKKFIGRFLSGSFLFSMWNTHLVPSKRQIRLMYIAYL